MLPVLPVPAIAAIVIGVTAIAGFGGGFMVSDWRSGERIAKLEGTNSVLTSVNRQCETNVRNVHAAMAALTQAAEDLERQALAAMRQAEPEVKKRTATITKIKALPTVSPDGQCEAIKREQIEYVQMRRGS